VVVVPEGEPAQERWCHGQQQSGLDFRFRDHQFGHFRNDRKRHQSFRHPGHEPELKYDGQSERSKQYEQAKPPALKRAAVVGVLHLEVMIRWPDGAIRSEAASCKVDELAPFHSITSSARLAACLEFRGRASWRS
jgi:hypothetical protein